MRMTIRAEQEKNNMIKIGILGCGKIAQVGL